MLRLALRFASLTSLGWHECRRRLSDIQGALESRVEQTPLLADGDTHAAAVRSAMCACVGGGVVTPLLQIRARCDAALLRKLCGACGIPYESEEQASAALAHRLLLQPLHRPVVGT